MNDQDKKIEETVGEFIRIEVYELDASGKYCNEKPETTISNIRPGSIRELRAFTRYNSKSGKLEIDESEFILDTGEFRRSPENALHLQGRIEAMLKAQRNEDYENYFSKISQTINAAATPLKSLESESYNEKKTD